MSTQSNPVVFVVIGQGANIWPHLSKSLQKHASAVACVQIQNIEDIAKLTEDHFDTWVKTEIGRVWKEFLHQSQHQLLREQYSADIVRVNYILGTDSSGLALPTIRQYIEKYLTSLYPAGVITDIYCVLDDDRILENEDSRRQVMAMLNSESVDNLRIYLLSNLTSQNLLVSDESIADTIAMLTVFKDCIPDTYVTGADASRYNELYFTDNCYAKQGQFLTASTLNMTIPQDGLKALLLAELLAFGKTGEREICANALEESILSATSIVPKPTRSMEYLLGLAIPELSDISSLTHGQLISHLFGTRLDQIIQSNHHVGEEDDCLLDLVDCDSNFYDLLRRFCPSGRYSAYITNAIEKTTNDLHTLEKKIRLWKTEMPAISKSGPMAEKRRLSPLISQELWPFAIALEYMKKQSALDLLLRKVNVFQKRYASVNATYDALLEHQQKINDTIAQYLKTAEVLDSAFASFTPCASDYFRKIFKVYADENPNELVNISIQMTAALLNGNFQNFLQQAEDYIQENILSSSHFNKPILDTMAELIADDDSSHQDKLAEALGEWIFNHRQWNIRLKTGYTNLHTEINIYMPTQGAAKVKHNYEARGFGRMNLFADENADRVSVLYHAGTFNLEDLYYESLYRQEGEQWTSDM